LVAQDYSAVVQIHTKETKNALTESGRRTNGNSTKCIERHPGIRRENSKAQLNSRQKEKTGERNELGRHGNNVGSTEDNQSNSKLPLRVKASTMEHSLQHDSEKPSTKSQVF